MSSPDLGVIIIGAGVIGLALARAFALAGESVLVLERAKQFGSETSSRSSEVIHAGIYYQHGSLKARLCMEGRDRLYAFCKEHGVPHRRCGKLIVAADAAQAGQLEALQSNAERCGVGDLRMLDAHEAAGLEPDLACAAAILSPSTGIVDSHAFMQALLGAAEANGATLVCNTEVTGILPSPGGWSVTIQGSEEPAASSRIIVNAAGLAAEAIARRIWDFPAAHVPRLRFAKGSYFSYGGRVPFHHLIYPLPEPGGLGTHLTLDLSGRARFGPDVEWIDHVDYTVDPNRRDRVAGAVRRFWPGVDPLRLNADYAGVRPKLSGPGEDAADFSISGPRQHGRSGIVNLFGIESPGITASLAIADHVRDQLLAA